MPTQSNEHGCLVLDGKLEPKSMILIMGVTGSGKSYFINTLLGRDEVETSSSLLSCTRCCQIVPAKVFGSVTALIDTPGFDDTNRSNAEILEEISLLLSGQYVLGLKLKGILYMHRITDPRFQGSSFKTFRMLGEICGEDAMSNVFLVTTRWNEVEKAVGVAREWELREHFWGPMLSKGSKMIRFWGDRDSAIGICSQLLGKKEVVLKLQSELVREQLRLNQTAAGSIVHSETVGRKEEYGRSLREMEMLDEGGSKSHWKFSRESLRREIRDVSRDEQRLEKAIGPEVERSLRETKLRLGRFIPGVLKLLCTLVDLGVAISS